MKSTSYGSFALGAGAGSLAYILIVDFAFFNDINFQTEFMAAVSILLIIFGLATTPLLRRRPRTGDPARI